MNSIQDSYNGRTTCRSSRLQATMCALAALALAPGAAMADEGRSGRDDRGFDVGAVVTLGEGVHFVSGDVHRGPVSLEVMPFIGWAWFSLDLGLYTRFESVRVPGSHIGDWHFAFRPGGRLSPPLVPLYFRLAFPLQLQKDNFDYGVLFGVGVDIRLIPVLGLVLEVDTTLNHDLDWGRAGLPLEFRGGMSLHL